MNETRLQMRLEDWPAGDREAWGALFREGDIFDGRGEAVHWSQATRKTNRKHYGRWLGWLDITGNLDSAAAPWDRATPDRVAAFARDEMNRVASSTVASTLIGLKCVLIRMNPDRNWNWLRDITNRLKTWAEPVTDHRDRLIPADEIMCGVLTELERLASETTGTWADSLRFRDALMIGFLTSCPVRLKNLTSIRINQHLYKVGEDWWLSFCEQETKNKQAISYIIPRTLTASLEYYLQHVRPGFSGADDTTALWLGQKSKPLASETIYMRVMMMTGILFGIAINPHRFRTIAATWLAEQSAEDALFARPLLGHRNPATTERHYIRASNIEASRRVSAALIELRDGQ